MWTLVVVLAISGNLIRYLETENKEEFLYTFEIVPVAISVLFGINIGIPLALQMAVTCFGNELRPDQKVPVLVGIGIYSYSFSSFIISSMLCGFIPINTV